MSTHSLSQFGSAEWVWSGRVRVRVGAECVHSLKHASQHNYPGKQPEALPSLITCVSAPPPQAKQGGRVSTLHAQQPDLCQYIYKAPRWCWVRVLSALVSLNDLAAPNVHIIYRERRGRSRSTGKFSYKALAHIYINMRAREKERRAHDHTHRGGGQLGGWRANTPMRINHVSQRNPATHLSHGMPLVRKGRCFLFDLPIDYLQTFLEWVPTEFVIFSHQTVIFQVIHVVTDYICWFDTFKFTCL